MTDGELPKLRQAWNVDLPPAGMTVNRRQRHQRPPDFGALQRAFDAETTTRSCITCSTCRTSMATICGAARRGAQGVLQGLLQSLPRRRWCASATRSMPPAGLLDHACRLGWRGDRQAARSPYVTRRSATGSSSMRAASGIRHRRLYGAAGCARRDRFAVAGRHDDRASCARGQCGQRLDVPACATCGAGSMRGYRDESV